MTWAKGIVGVVLVLVGLLWIGQGINLVPGSFMSGQVQFAVIGLVLLVVGGWLLWGVSRGRAAT
jgi:hypothetical protein